MVSSRTIWIPVILSWEGRGFDKEDYKNREKWHS